MGGRGGWTAEIMTCMMGFDIGVVLGALGSALFLAVGKLTVSAW
jgi:hypothetical protein